MKKKKYIEFVVTQDGSFTAEGQNFEGPECNVFMKAFEQIGKVTKRKNKPDIKKVQRCTTQRNARS